MTFTKRKTTNSAIMLATVITMLFSSSFGTAFAQTSSLQQVGVFNQNTGFVDGAIFGDGANVVVTEDGLVYVASEQIGETSAGYLIYNIDDILANQNGRIFPPFPEILNIGIAADIAVRDNLAFVTITANQEDTQFGKLKNGLAIFDVSNPTNPQLRSNLKIQTSEISDILVSEGENNLAYVTSPEREELTIIIFNSLGLSSVLDTIKVPGGVSEVAVTEDGTTIIIGDTKGNEGTRIGQTSTLTIFDPIKGIRSTLVFNVPDESGFEFDPYAIVLDETENFAYVSGGFTSTDIAVIDISNRDDPILEQFIETGFSGNGFGMTRSNDLVMVVGVGGPTGLEGRLGVIDITNPANPIAFDALETFGVSVDVSSATIAGKEIVTVANGDFTAFIPGVPNLEGGFTIFEVTP